MAVYHCVLLCSVCELPFRNSLCTPVWFSTLTVFSQLQQMILIFRVFALVSIGSYAIIQIVLCAESVVFEDWQNHDPPILSVDNVALH